ncbi:sushi, von Willebrand factor type A, EGF and pentraxin domain-containing protein 1-like [Lineus longissimus]|uniref:sushi, von Willebrand factor type A, EGF and pentraxin domain-containing protein 1-like n=1 Tax=Lineus longissimus TaxID=88925 RepID=UPI002B4E2AC2
MKLFTSSLVVLFAAAAVDLGHGSIVAQVFGRSAAAVPRDSIEVNAAKLDHFLMTSFGNEEVIDEEGLVMSYSYNPEFDEKPMQKMHDIILLLDSSGSIGADDFLKAIQFLANFVNLIPSTISPANTRFACISFSEADKIITEFNFHDHSNRSSVVKAIQRITYQDGASTHTTKALRRAQALFASNGRDNAKKFVFMATDGRSNGGGNPAVPANEMKNTDRGDVQIDVFAVSDNVNKQEIDAIASSPPSQHVYDVETFADATNITENVRGKMEARGIMIPH